MAPPAEGQQGEPATPEEQALYDEVVSRAYLLMFDEKTRKPRASVVKMLQSGEPKQALGETAANVFHRVEMEAAKAGQPIPDSVKEGAGADVFSKMAELASKVGETDFMADDDAFSGAFYIAVNTLQQLEKQSGMEDPEKTSADFDQLIQADQSGQLAAMMGTPANTAAAPPAMPMQQGMG
jgi:hypothetical protein